MRATATRLGRGPSRSLTYLNPEGETETATAEPVTTQKAPEPAPAGVNKVDDVSAAFDELFND